MFAGLSRLSSVTLSGLLVHSNRKSSNTTARDHLDKNIFALSPLHEHAVAWSEVLLAQAAGIEPAAAADRISAAASHGLHITGPGSPAGPGAFPPK